MKNLHFIPLSGITGANLEKTGGVEECSWYSGYSLVEAIGKWWCMYKAKIFSSLRNVFCCHVDAFAPPQRQISKPFRMTVSDVSKSMSLGQTITGRIYAGAAAVGDSVKLLAYAIITCRAFCNEIFGLVTVLLDANWTSCDGKR